jgi:ATP dependent DNA ligase domain
VKEGFDVILDGEIIAWDSERKETIPFGNNRTIANLRKKWMKSQGLLDERDQGMHDNDKDNKSMNTTNSWPDKNDQISELAGKECWLQFIAFDILYVDGPGAADLLAQTVSEHIAPRPSAGSVIHLDAFERKKILYKLVEPQADEVEIVQTWIIRPSVSSDLRSSWLASALSLARVMGAFVTYHLHDGVTHVLCDLTEGNNEIVFGDGVTESAFSDPRRGRRILDRLEELEGRNLLRDRVVVLVSPAWVRKRKWHRDAV